MRDYKIVEKRLIDKDGERKAIAVLDNGTEIHIEPCYESWRQYGGTTNELWATVDFADSINDWLHGNEEEQNEWD